MRYVYVVSREHPWLYSHLVERFRDDPDVEVILDRRHGERRARRVAKPAHDRRGKAERRRPVAPDDDLRVRSHYIVAL